MTNHTQIDKGKTEIQFGNSRVSRVPVRTRSHVTALIMKTIIDSYMFVSSLSIVIPVTRSVAQHQNIKKGKVGISYTKDRIRFIIK